MRMQRACTRRAIFRFENAHFSIREKRVLKAAAPILTMSVFCGVFDMSSIRFFSFISKKMKQLYIPPFFQIAIAFVWLILVLINNIHKLYQDFDAFFFTISFFSAFFKLRIRYNDTKNTIQVRATKINYSKNYKKVSTYILPSLISIDMKHEEIVIFQR